MSDGSPFITVGCELANSLTMDLDCPANALAVMKRRYPIAAIAYRAFATVPRCRHAEILCENHATVWDIGEYVTCWLLTA